MLKLTALDKKVYYINPMLVEHFYAAPDTVIVLSSGKKLLVVEKPEEIQEQMNAYLMANQSH